MLAGGLDTIETYDTRSRVLDEGKWSVYKAEALRVARVLALVDSERARRMRRCARRVYAYWGSGERHIYGAEFCHDALCPVCAWRKSLYLYKRLSSKVEQDIPFLSHLVLTLRNRASIAGMVDDLWAYWRKLSRRRWFKRLVSGYYVSLEFTNRGRGWHGHLHVMVALREDLSDEELHRIKVEKVEREWQGITGDSFVCEWVRAQDVHEVVKYVSNMVVYEGGGEEELLALAREIKGRRMRSAGGVFRGYDVEVTSEEMLEGDGISEVEPEVFEEWEFDESLGRYVLKCEVCPGDLLWDRLYANWKRRKRRA